MDTQISRYDDTIDSRDVDERIGELEADEGRDEADNEELAALIAFRDEAKPYCADWDYGETLIAGRYFKSYAMGLAEDIGAIDLKAPWPTNCIDWDEAADLLRQDYTSAEFGGYTFWFR